MLSRITSCLVVVGSFAFGCSDPDSDTDNPNLGSGATASAGIGGAVLGSGGAAAVVGSGGTTAAGGLSGSGTGGTVTAAGGASSPGGQFGTGGEVAAAGSGGSAGEGTAGGSAGEGAAGDNGGGNGEPVKSAGCGSTEAPQSDTYTIDVGGTNRTYILRIPDAYDANHPYRLILSYHPLGGTAEAIARGDYYGLGRLSNGSTIFAAPQGLGNRWSDSGRSRTSGGEDIAFTQALVDKLTSELCIDRSRIFAEGFSMGGSMSYAIACAMGDVVRGVVAHSGGPMSGCVEHDTPVAYFMTHGTTDRICTYPEYGVPQIEDFADVNGCTPAEMPTPTGSGPACMDYTGCMDGYPARACIFIGGHTPSPEGGWVPTESWEFISQF